MADGAALTGRACGRRNPRPWPASPFPFWWRWFSGCFASRSRPIPLDASAWPAKSSSTITAALNLMPFVGIAFLWFIGVLRDRLGQQEDRFFATVFLGSAMLFLAMLFASAAVIGAIMLVFSAGPGAMINSATLLVARAIAYNLDRMSTPSRWRASS